MAKLYEKIMSFKLLAIVIIDFKRYPSTYCLMQGRSFFKLFTSKLESQPLRKHMDITQR